MTEIKKISEMSKHQINPRHGSYIKWMNNSSIINEPYVNLWYSPRQHVDKTWFQRAPTDVVAQSFTTCRGRKGGHIPVRWRLPARVFSWEPRLLLRSLHLLSLHTQRRWIFLHRWLMSGTSPQRYEKSPDQKSMMKRRVTVH